MIQEYDVVIASRNLPNSVYKGTKAAVVMVYTEPKLAYEVEFVDGAGNTLDVITAYPNDIKKVF